MQKILVLAFLWLMPVQAFHNAARLRSLQFLLKPNSIPTTINTNRSLLNMHMRPVKIMPSLRHAQPAPSTVSWFSRLRNAWNSLFKQQHQPNVPNKKAYANFIKSSAAFSIGTGISVYTLQQQRECLAAELPLTWDEIKDPTKLQTKIHTTPDHEKPTLAVDIVRYLATYLDSYRWRFALSTAISTYPDIAYIIVDFLIQYPTHITQNTKECVAVVEFLMAHNKNVAEPIKNCVISNRSVLKKTTYGPDIINLIEKYIAAQNAKETDATRS